MAQIILFVTHYRIAMLVLESLIAVQLVLCMLATFSKTIYNTPILVRIEDYDAFTIFYR